MLPCVKDIRLKENRIHFQLKLIDLLHVKAYVFRKFSGIKIVIRTTDYYFKDISFNNFYLKIKNIIYNILLLSNIILKNGRKDNVCRFLKKLFLHLSEN